MGLISGKGSEINLDSKVDLSKVLIRLKDGEAVRVRLLGLDDYVEYKAHGDYNLKVYTQPCIEPLGKQCPLCVASKSGVEGFDGLYPKKRYLFAFADIDTGDIRVWDCSKNQAKDLLGQIQEYAEDINDTAFNFKRTGTKTATSYKLNPILKLKGNDKEKFTKFDGEKIDISFFESVLVPRSNDMILNILAEAGFPMEQFFPNYTPEKDKEVSDSKEEEPNF